MIADKEELLMTYDETEKPLGLVYRSIVHEKQLFHKEVAIWIINSQKQLLLERRSIYKKLNPGRYSLCAGHIVGLDDIEETIIREANEEIGFDIRDLDYRFVIKVKREEKNNYCFSYHYFLFYDIDISSLRIQMEELSEVILMDYENFKELVRKNDSSVALIWSEAYQKVFAAIDKCIKETIG